MLNSHLAGNLCNIVKKQDILFKEEYEWKMEKVLKSKTIKEFDSSFTSIHFGYGNVDNYYKQATLHNKLHKIKVPTLCLSAADDPFQPLDGEFNMFDHYLHTESIITPQLFRSKVRRSLRMSQSSSHAVVATLLSSRVSGQVRRTNTCRESSRNTSLLLSSIKTTSLHAQSARSTRLSCLNDGWTMRWL